MRFLEDLLDDICAFTGIDKDQVYERTAVGRYARWIYVYEASKHPWLSKEMIGSVIKRGPSSVFTTQCAIKGCREDDFLKLKQKWDGSKKCTRTYY